MYMQINLLIDWLPLLLYTVIVIIGIAIISIIVIITIAVITNYIHHHYQ